MSKSELKRLAVQQGKKLPEWPGDCFQRAGFEMIQSRDNKTMRLVHARVPDSYNPGRWVDHAWCEVEGSVTYIDDDGKELTKGETIVIDMAQPHVHSRIVPKSIYYEQTTPRDITLYTFAQMCDMAKLYGHDGPWTKK